MQKDIAEKRLDGTLRQGNRDILMEDKRNGRYRLICGEENQSDRDNTMPERVMGYDYAAYEKQIRELIKQNDEAGTSAYAKQIHDDQRLAPVITSVLYWGKEDMIGAIAGTAEYKHVRDVIAERNKKSEEQEDVTMNSVEWEIRNEYRVEALAEGREEGEDCFGRLNLVLLAEKRYSDLERASKDRDYRKQLYQEYGI